MNTRGQVQIGEMVMILVVVFILGMSALVWFLNSSQNETERVVDEDVRIELAQTARMIADLPELKYTLAGREDATIIDWQRARVFAGNIDGLGLPVYRERFTGYSVQLDCVTPCQGRAFGTLMLFDYTSSTAREAIPFVIPVLLYNPVTKESSFGTLTITRTLE